MRIESSLPSNLPPAGRAPRAPGSSDPVDTVTLGSAPPDVKSRPWQDEIVYMVMTDRFCNGDKTNDGDAVPGDPDKWHGGDFRGLIDKLDYIKDLGATAIWITPVEKNQKDGYHGYWPVDFDHVDPHLGDMKTLKELVDEAHKRGIKVILDRVVNHTGYKHPWATDPEKYKWFHHSGPIHWTDQHSLEVGSLHGLPDLAQENPEVADWLIANNKWWQQQTGVDGFRLDAVKHVPSEFWKQYTAAMKQSAGPNFFTVGEVFRSLPDYLARYQREDGIDSVFDVPFNDTVRNDLTVDSDTKGPSIFSRAWDVVKNHKYMLWNEMLRKLTTSSRGDMRDFSRLFKSDAAYQDPNMLATIFDNHDLTRFMTEAGENGKAKLKMAMAILMTVRGIPTVLYGTEVGMEGRAGEHNRDDMQFGKDPELTDYFKHLTAIRRDNVELRRGRQVEIAADRETYAFARVHDQGTTVVAVNNSREEQSRALPGGTIFKDGDRFRDLLTGREYSCENGHLSVTMASKQPLILKKII